MARVTLKDVARHAGVSFKTVSRVLNNEKNVAPQTAEKVRQVISDLHYVPNSAARALSSGKAMSIGLVTGWAIDSPYVATFIEQTLEGCMELGYSLALFTSEPGISKKIVNAYIGKQIMGVLVDTNSSKDQELMDQIRAFGVPHVIIHPNDNTRHPDSSYITINNSEAVKQAAQYLIALGHKAIGYVTAFSGLIQEAERLHGYRTALLEAGIPFHDEWVYKGEFSLRRGNPSIVGLLGAKHLLHNNPELTAILAETDEIALGMVSAVWQLGMKIPDDISVIGFDDVSYASVVVPPLTTIHQPIDEIAKTAIQHLRNLIDDPSTEPIDIVMPTKLIIRESCKAPRIPAATVLEK